MEQGVTVQYPAGLLDWAGNRRGGVRRMFYSSSGRPTGGVIRTRLISLLEDWATSIVSRPDNPRIVLLVGGPGNGKTEAVEIAVDAIDGALDLEGRLKVALQKQFLPPPGVAVPRLAVGDIKAISNGRFRCALRVVQDASSADAGSPLKTPAELLVDELSQVMAQESQDIYLACINRGVLDEASVVAIEARYRGVKELLDSVVRAIGMSPDAPSCWPLEGFSQVAVWPMDVETLVGVGSLADESPGAQLLSRATYEGNWPEYRTCSAGDKCPFCTSRSLLAKADNRQSLLSILRAYELASGKRWSFRDLFSIVSYLLAGVPPDEAGATYNPCDWAARLIDLGARATGRESQRLSAPYLLVAAQYQHALFGSWIRTGGRQLRADITELKLQDNAALMGLYYFLSRNSGRSIPNTLESQLSRIAEELDPSFADSDLEVEVSSKTKIRYRDLDLRFSQSVEEGFRFIQRYKCLSSLEVELLRKLASLDNRLGEPDLMTRRPAVARRVQSLVREFSCRLVRRSVGVLAGVVRDVDVLRDFEKVVAGDSQLLHDAVKQVEGLLNDKDKFLLTLNTTFGEPLPPAQRRAVLSTPKQKVRPKESAAKGRPSAPIRFLGVGGMGGQSIPLTYELFKSVRDLKRGMTPASLPRTVVALLDTTRAKLSGHIVRDEDFLDGSEIRIGTRDEVIIRELGQFLVRRESLE